MAYIRENSTSSLCPHCGQRMPQMRCGVRLYPQTARVFDCIRRAGEAGISSRDILAIAWSGAKKPRRRTVTSHITIIKNFLLETNWMIGGLRTGSDYVYRLVKIKYVHGVAIVCSTGKPFHED
jgi:hypothetical protein